MNSIKRVKEERKEKLISDRKFATWSKISNGKL